MLTKRLYPILGLAFLTLGYPIGFAISTLMPSFGGFWNLQWVLIMFLIPCIGGILVASKWRLYTIPIALVCPVSAFYSMQIVVAITHSQNPDYLCADCGLFALIALVIGSLGTVSASLAAVIVTTLRWVFDRGNIERTGQSSQVHGHD